MTISVLIPAYNAERTLAETLASVLGQTLPPKRSSLSTTAQPIIRRMSRPPRRNRLRSSGRPIAERPRPSMSGCSTRAAICSPFSMLTTCGNATNSPCKLGFWLNSPNSMAWPVISARFFVRPTTKKPTNGIAIPDGPEPCWLLGAMLLRRQCFKGPKPFAENLAAGFHIDWYDRARENGLVVGMIPNIVLRRRIHPGSLGHRSRQRDVSMVEMARRAIERRRASGGGDRVT